MPPPSWINKDNQDGLHLILKEGLDELRKRLIDLSKSNKLLNFKHGSKTGRRNLSNLRVIDELPDELFKRLTGADAKLTFKPVPERDSEKPHEQSDITDQHTSLTIVQTDDNVPGSSRRISAKDRAIELGIDPSYDLPEPGRQRDPKHFDKYIQTLHYPPDLEAILRRISTNARTAIEESGTNMLYLVFGFLEWYESPDSSEPLLAPLVALPVEIIKDQPSQVLGGMFAFSVVHTGEDLLTNLSLVERMKRDFALSIPLIQEEDSPETYFHRFKGILESQPRWRIRRHITLTLLHFGKLLMFLDLDHSKNTILLDHPRIGEFLGGTKVAEESCYGEVYNLDDPGLATEIPPIVCEADSSQHSALIDVFRGKNVVIEGPPGTGKSQTITNLIAAALSEGKKVLFVSEKLAALEVVRRRLDRVGLGDFCLELHSHRTKKDQLLKDVQQRIQKQRSFAECGALGDKIKSQERHKSELIEHVRIMSAPFGTTRKNIFDIFWSRERLLQKHPFLEKLAPSLILSNCEQISCADQEAQRFELDVYQRHLAALLVKYPSALAHPLAGIENTNLTFRQEIHLREKLNNLQSHLNAVKSALSDITATTGISFTPTRNRIQKLITKWPHPPSTGRGHVDLLPSLSDVRTRSHLRDFIGDCRAWMQRRQGILGSFSDLTILERSDIGVAKRLLSGLVRTCFSNQTRASLNALRERLLSLRSHLKKLSSFTEEVARSLGIPYEGQIDVLPQFRVLCQLLQATDVQIVHLWNPALGNPRFDEIRTVAKAEAFRIGREITVLSKEYSLSQLPPEEELWKHATTVSSSSILQRLFSGEYRAARICYQALKKQTEQVKWSRMAADLRELAEHRQRATAFNQNREYREGFGDSFKGLKTPFDDITKLQTWHKQVCTAFDSTIPGSEKFAFALQAQPADAIRILALGIERDPDIPDLLSSITDELKSLAFALGNNELRNVSKTLYGTIGAIDASVSEMERAGNVIEAVGLREELTVEEMIASLEEAHKLRDEAESLASSTTISCLLGSKYLGCHTDCEELEATLSLAASVYDENIPLEIQKWLIATDSICRMKTLYDLIETLKKQVFRFTEEWDAFTQFVDLDNKRWYLNYSGEYDDLNLEIISDRITLALQGCSDVQAWLEYIRCRKPLTGSPLQPLLTLADKNELRPDQFLIAYDFALHNGLTEAILKSNPSLVSFTRVRHETIREKFAALDEEIIALNSKQAAYKISRAKVNGGVGIGSVKNYTDRALIEHEVQKQRGHIPIRSLLHRAAQALLALKPCFMMGPMSVAQYLEPGKFMFDMVVMDEASQLKPEDALGAISRSSQVIVVGDPKQLPPTSFFDMLSVEANETDEDDTLAIQESRSILDRACEVYQPVRQLRWHYRSRHESLIAFSNSEFYDHNLILFPSPEKESANLGVKYHSVKDGVYNNRVNRREADQLVCAILAHMAERPNESLGVVTLNSAQRDLVEELFDAARKTDPIAEAYETKWKDGHEPFFIKNLETVQGDERDCIFISFTFGHDVNGNLYQRFGPINGADGHRRLNVLFTRAKLRTEVFSSIDADDIMVDATSSRGLRAMKGYLKYARTGILGSTGIVDGPEPNDFELAVSNALKDRGLQVDLQIGVAGYFIDLAVCHPTKKGCYVLGIECDGATYHSAKSARDRDRLREANLRNLGWEIHRIWSTDWFKNSASEIDRVKRLVTSLLNSSPA